MPHHHFGDLTLDFEIVPSVIPSLIHGHTIRSYDVRFEFENDDETLFILKMEISRCQHTTQVWIDRTIVDCPGLPFETTLIHTLAKTGQDSFQTQTFGGTILGTDEKRRLFKSKWEEGLNGMLGDALSFEVPTFIHEFLSIENEVFQQLDINL